MEQILRNFIRLIVPQEFARLPQHATKEHLFYVLAQNLGFGFREDGANKIITIPATTTSLQRTYTLNTNGEIRVISAAGNVEATHAELLKDCFRAYSQRPNSANPALAAQNQQVLAAPDDDEFLDEINNAINAALPARLPQLPQPRQQRPQRQPGGPRPQQGGTRLPRDPATRLRMLRTQLYDILLDIPFETNAEGVRYKPLWIDPNNARIPYVYQDGRELRNQVNNLLNDEDFLNALIAYNKARNLGDVPENYVGDRQIPAQVFTPAGGNNLFLTRSGKLLRQADNGMLDLIPPKHADFRYSFNEITQQINDRTHRANAGADAGQPDLAGAGIAPLEITDARFLCKPVEVRINGRNTNLYEFADRNHNSFYYNPANNTYLHQNADGRGFTIIDRDYYEDLNGKLGLNSILLRFLQSEQQKQAIAGRELANELKTKGINNIAIERSFLQEENKFFLYGFFEECERLNVKCHILLKPQFGLVLQGQVPVHGIVSHEQFPVFLMDGDAPMYGIEAVPIGVARNQDLEVAEKLTIQRLNNPRETTRNNQTFVIAQNINSLFRSPEDKAKDARKREKIQAKLDTALQELEQIPSIPHANPKKEKARSADYNKAWAKVQRLRDDLEKVSLNTSVLNAKLTNNTVLAADPTLAKLFSSTRTLSANSANQAVSYLREPLNTHARHFDMALHQSPTTPRSGKDKEKVMASGAMENSTIFRMMFDLPGFYAVSTNMGEFGFGLAVDKKDKQTENYVFFEIVDGNLPDRTKTISIITDPAKRELCKAQLNHALRLSHNYIHNFYKVEDHLVRNRKNFDSRNNQIRIIPFIGTIPFIEKDLFHPIDISLRDDGKKTVRALKIELVNEGGESEFYMLYQKGGGIHKLKGKDIIPGDRLYGDMALAALTEISQRAGIQLDELREMEPLAQAPRAAPAALPARARRRAIARRNLEPVEDDIEQNDDALEEYNGDNYAAYFINRYGEVDNSDDRDFRYSLQEAADLNLYKLFYENDIIQRGDHGRFKMSQKSFDYARRSTTRKLEIAIETHGDRPREFIDGDRALEAWVQTQSKPLTPRKPTPIFYPTPDRPIRDGGQIAYKFRGERFVNMHFENVDFRGSGANLFLNCTFGKGCLFPTPDQDLDPNIARSDRWNYMQTHVRQIAKEYEELNQEMEEDPEMNTDNNRRRLAILAKDLYHAKRRAPLSPYDELARAHEAFSNCTFTAELLEEVAQDRSQRVTYENVFGIHDFTQEQTKRVIRDNQAQARKNPTFSDTHRLTTGHVEELDQQEIQAEFDRRAQRDLRSFKRIEERPFQPQPQPQTQRGRDLGQLPSSRVQTGARNARPLSAGQQQELPAPPRTNSRGIFPTDRHRTQRDNQNGVRHVSWEKRAQAITNSGNVYSTEI